MKKLLLFLFPFLFIQFLSAQVYNDYIGAGHSNGITVTSSDNFQETGQTKIASGKKTITGTGLEGAIMDASRFLAQATFGVDHQTILDVSQMDFEDWIEQQIDIQPKYMLPTMMEVYNMAIQIYENNGGNPINYDQRPQWEHFDYAWWHIIMTGDDLLRQRIALALSEILVVSADSDLFDLGESLGDYYDILIEHALGNYFDLLLDVTLHPSMGVYLSHLNNPKSIPEQNIHPDENYAREIMQLFSIGLFELNLDGTRKTDVDGNFIPTYDNDDIKEFAKVFTGLGAGGVIEQDDGLLPQFNLGLNRIDFTIPMAMYEDWHETGEKHLLNGFIIPEGQDGMTDIEQAVEHIFLHPNIGPFIGKQLIQRLVKSNPSPGYISRVASAFNDNGEGERGDLSAVVKAILLDEEARVCNWLDDNTQGRLREPVTRFSQFAKSIGAENDLELYWHVGDNFAEATGQHPFHSASVFNFFLPDFQPNGAVASMDLVAPEFQIHNTKTSIGYVNTVNEWAVEGDLFYTDEEYPFNTSTDFSELMEFARDPDVLINRLDVLLTSGQLTEDTRTIIKNAIDSFPDNEIGDLGRVNLALYLIMISPDYNVLR